MKLVKLIAAVLCGLLIVSGVGAAFADPAHADATGGVYFGGNLCVPTTQKCVPRGALKANTYAWGNQVSGQDATWTYAGRLCNWRLDWVFYDDDSKEVTRFRGVTKGCATQGHASLFNAADTERAPSVAHVTPTGKVCARFIAGGSERAAHCNFVSPTPTLVRTRHGVARYLDADCLDADLNTIGRDGTTVQLWTCNGTRQQQWVFGADGTVRSVYDTRFCLDADLNTLAVNPTRVQLWTCNGQPQQQWRVIGQGPGRTLQNVLSSKVLDADLNTIGRSGATVQLWSPNGQIQQKWS